MSLYKPKNSPYWHFDFQYKGVRHYGSTGCEKHADAKEIESAKRTELAKMRILGVPNAKPQMTVTQVLDRYYLEISEHRKDPSTDLARLATIADLLGPQTPFQDVTDDKIAQMVARLRSRTVAVAPDDPDEPGTRKLIANGTVNRYTEALRRVWRRANKIWKITTGDEPLWGEHMLPEPSERVRELTADEQARLMAVLRPDYQPLVEFALMSGVRLGNLRRLTWHDVDFSTREIRIKIKSKKLDGEPLTVPLTSAMVTLLANQRGQHPIYVFTYECHRPRTIRDASGKIKGRRKGDRYPFSDDGWRRVWQAALRDANIHDFRFHDCRHTAATRTLRASGNLKVVQNMLGHTDITTTGRYAHALTEDIRAAMEAAQGGYSSPKSKVAES